MNAAKRIRKFLEQNPDNETSGLLSRLVVSIGEESSISLEDLYALNYETFGYVLELLKEWRLDRYNVSKLRLLDAVLAPKHDVAPASGAPTNGNGGGAEPPAVAQPPRN